MSGHVAIFTFPIPALVNPTFSIVTTLIRRGYRVTYVTSERFAAEATALGAEVLRCPRLDYPFDQDDESALPIERQYVRDPITLAYRTFATAWPFYERNKPDFIIYDSQSFAGILAADRSGVPAVRMSNQFAYNDVSLNSPAIPPAWKEKQLSVEKQANEFFASYDSRRTNVIRNSKEDTFYLFLPDLQLSGLPSERDVFYAPRCTAERPNIPQWRRPAGPPRGPTALVASSTTYGQSAQYYESCLAALSRLGWETILVVSGGTSGESESLPRKCLPVYNVPLPAIMPHVDLLICAAGMASAMEAAYHGLPMLMLTGGHPEMEAYAERFHNYGMGLHLNRTNANPENVARSAARIISDAQLQQTVRRVRNAVRGSAGAEELVNWMEGKMPA
jgi:MGT family glycosyltransferase